MEIVDVHAVAGNSDAVVVGRAVHNAAFDAAAGHPRGKDLVVMFAPLGVRRLVVRRASELGRPDDECLVE